MPYIPYSTIHGTIKVAHYWALVTGRSQAHNWLDSSWAQTVNAARELESPSVPQQLSTSFVRPQPSLCSVRKITGWAVTIMDIIRCTVDHAAVTAAVVVVVVVWEFVGRQEWRQKTTRLLAPLPVLVWNKWREDHQPEENSSNNGLSDTQPSSLHRFAAT